MTADVSKLLEQSRQLQSERTQWNNHWQLVAEYVLQRKATFTIEEEAGAFINSDVWTDVPAKAMETAASALLGLMWPDSYSFQLEPMGELKDDEEVKKWFEESTETLQAAMDDPEAGLDLALDEFIVDYLTFGTPAMHVEEGEVSDFRFDAWNVSQFCIDEGPNGYVDTFYKHQKYSVRNLVTKFGEDKVSKKTLELYKNKKYLEKIKVLHIIKPRDVDPKKGRGSKNMPYASIWIEVENKHLLREGGYNELPTFAARYSKRIGEVYGRSPAMRALPTIMELNALWEMVTLGIEKNYDPPLAVYDDGTFGGGTIDTSAGAINVLNMSGKLTANAPIQPLFTVGNFGDIAVLIERLEQTIGDHFLIDILLDLQNDKEMTASEYMGRMSIRQKATRSPVSRLISELFNRMIERCFNMQYRKGRFGYPENSPEYIAAVNAGEDPKIIPEKIVEMQGQNKRVYYIRYLTPAAREQRSEEAQGIVNTYDFILNISKDNPSARTMVHDERAAKHLGDIWSAPLDIFKTKEEMETQRKAETDANKEASDMQQAQSGAAIAKDLAMAQNAGRSATPAA